MATAHAQQFHSGPAFQHPSTRRPTNYATSSNNVYRDQQQPAHQQQQRTGPKEMQPPPPPLPRQNSKTVPPSPPKTIRDLNQSLMYTRIGFLGEGGFARVYEAADLQGKRFAIKVVTKTSLKTKKSRTKLYAEIRLHRSLEHPNIVGFKNCFEDGENVYMTLELCENGSMMDMLRRRKRFSEPETRYYLIQVLGACHYMHVNQVIHRDLKLGNLFLDANMNIKVGDFGLAALIETPGERKKTICGTPNYIAPEVLFDTANGHSFEVDTWSTGVILYTLVVGKPPFQTKDVKAIYQRIRDNAYEFPADRVLSEEVCDLIQAILNQDPSQRPSLHEIVDHRFFTGGIVPLSIPATAHDEEPYFGHVTAKQSRQNLARLRRNAGLDEHTLDMGSLTQSMSSMSIVTTSAIQRQRENAAQQEKEFAKAIQPGSPISTLLNSARQPLLKAQLLPNAPRDPPGGLLRKLQAAAPPAAASDRQANGAARPLTPLAEQDEEDPTAAAKMEKERTRELESQKARIVAQMIPTYGQMNEEEGTDPRESDNEIHPVQVNGQGRRVGSDDFTKPKRPERADMDINGRENVPPGAFPVPGQEADREIDKDRRRRPQVSSRSSAAPSSIDSVEHRQRPNQGIVPDIKSSKPPFTSTTTSLQPISAAPASTTATTTPRSYGFEVVAQTLTDAFTAKNEGITFSDPYARYPDRTPIFIVSWVDYCNKYGMGYALTDGTIGVHFNDSTTLLLAPSKLNLDYVSSRRSGSVYVRKHYETDVYPDDIQNKVYLLRHFESYMLERLYGEHNFCFQDLKRTQGMDFVQKYFRMKNVIVFKLSHEVLQFNFCDHTKMIISSKGHFVTYLDKHYNLTHHRLATIMERAIHPPAEADVKKLNEKLLNKLRYCKEVLVSILQVSQAAANPQQPSGAPEEPRAIRGAPAPNNRQSRPTSSDEEVDELDEPEVQGRGGRYYQ